MGPFRIYLKILSDLQDDRTNLELDSYSSMAEAVNDARKLYILHTKQQATDANAIDLEVIDHANTCVYSAKDDIYAVKKDPSIQRN